MKIRWYGQACFLLSSASGISVLLDPFGKGIGYKVPSLRADIVTVSHRHFDHDRVLAARGNFEVVSEACELTRRGIGILGIPTWHDAVQGRRHGPNTVFRLEIDGLRICHTGDLGHLLSSEELSALGRIDVLLQHAGGSFALDVRDAARLRAAIRPALTIPMHYRTRAMGLAGLLFRRVDDYLAATGASFRRAPCEIELGGSAPSPGADILVMDYE